MTKMARIEDEDFDLDLTNFEANHSIDHALYAPSDEEREQPEIPSQGPWDDQRPFDQLYGDESLWKAWLLIKADKVEEIKEGMWSVQGSQPYTVHILPSEGMPVPWATCNCPNGDARGGRPNCYHTAAVLSKILEIDLSETPKPEKKRPSRS